MNSHETGDHKGEREEVESELYKQIGQLKVELNTDQGVQFTSLEFTGLLDGAGISISMDGRGRALDNIFVERLWRSVKYEEVYLNNYETVREAKERLTEYFHFYNTERLHQSLGYRTPREIYFEIVGSTITSAG